MDETTLGARIRRILLAFAVALLVVAVPTWWLAHGLRSHIPPSPFATMPSPPVPPAEENGFEPLATLRYVAPELAADVKGLQGLLGEPIRGAHGTTSANPLETPFERFERIDRAAESLRAARIPASEVAKIDALLARPRFTDVCADATGDCHAVSAMRFSHAVYLTDWLSALDGDFAAADARAALLLGASLDLFRTARVFITKLVSLVVVRHTIDHIRVLYAAQRARGERSAVAPRIIGLLHGIAPGDFDLRTVLAHETSLIRYVLAERRKYRATGRCDLAYQPLFRQKPPLPLDEAATCRASDAYFVALVEWAGQPERTRGAPPPLVLWSEQRGGFLWNPGGDRLLDTISYDYGYGIRTYVSRSHLLERQRDALLTELTAP